MLAPELGFVALIVYREDVNENTRDGTRFVQYAADCDVDGQHGPWKDGSSEVVLKCRSRKQIDEP